MAFDLDNEELRATRKLHGQDDGLYEDKSDKNVENIETTNNKNKYTYIKEVAEKIVNEYREKYKGEKFCPEPSEQTCMAYEILHLLAEREQMLKAINTVEKEKSDWIKAYQEEKDSQFDLLKRIKELEEEVKMLDEAYTGTIKESKKWFDIAHNSIPTQVVIDVLQNNRNELFSMTYLSKEQYRPYEMQVERINKIEQELLEGEK